MRSIRRRSRNSSCLPLAVALLLAVAQLPSPAYAIRWSVSGTSCDGTPFGNLNVGVTCSSVSDDGESGDDDDDDDDDNDNDNDGNGSSSSSSTCRLGDTATVSGTMYATTSFEGDDDVILRACFFLGYYCPEIARISAGTLCDDWVTPTGGQEDCGTSGTYDVYNSQELPEYEDVPDALQWMVQSAVSVKMIVGDEEECGASQAAMESSSEYYGTSSSLFSFSSFGAASLAMLGIGACAARRRRNRRWVRRRGDGAADGDDDDDDDDRNRSSSRFVEMTDNMPIV